MWGGDLREEGMRALNYKGCVEHEIVNGKLKNEWSLILSLQSVWVDIIPL